jgi:hypothetical protein
MAADCLGADGGRPAVGAVAEVAARPGAAGPWHHPGGPGVCSVRVAWGPKAPTSPRRSGSSISVDQHRDDPRLFERVTQARRTLRGVGRARAVDEAARAGRGEASAARAAPGSPVRATPERAARR